MIDGYDFILQFRKHFLTAIVSINSTVISNAQLSYLML